MARTNAQKLQGWRAAGRDRQAKRRVGMEQRGRPETAVVNGALAEAVSFVLAEAAIAAGQGADPATLSIRALDIKRAAMQVLVDRKGYDRRETLVALGQRLGLRTEHLDPAYVPSLRPDSGAEASRAKAAA